MGDSNASPSVLKASTTTDKGEVGGSSPPRPTKYQLLTSEFLLGCSLSARQGSDGSATGRQLTMNRCGDGDGSGSVTVNADGVCL